MYLSIYRSGSSSSVGVSLSEETTVRSQYWNESLLSVAVDYLYPKMLLEIKQRIEMINDMNNIHHHHQHNQLQQHRVITDDQVEVLQGIYKYFIYLPRLSSTILKVAINSNNYWLSLQQHPYYVLHGIGYRTLKEVILPTITFNHHVTSYLFSIIPLAKCPLQIANDMLHISILSSKSMNIFTPSRLRSALLNKSLIQCQILKNNLSIVKTLLEYVLTDINTTTIELESEYIQRRSYRELIGCPLMPLADLSIKPFPRNASDQVAITPIILHLLLPLLKSSFLHPTLLKHLHIFNNNNIFLDTLFISKFSISFIDKHISFIIPNNWKLVPAICWLKSESITTTATASTVGLFSRLINRSSSSSLQRNNTTASTTTTNIHNNHPSSSSSTSSSASTTTTTTNLPSPLLLYVLWNDYLGNNYYPTIIVVYIWFINISAYVCIYLYIQLYACVYSCIYIAS